MLRASRAFFVLALAALCLATPAHARRFPARFQFCSIPFDGSMLMASGDINGDGYPDLVVRRLQRTDYSVFLGGSNGLTYETDLTLDPNPSFMTMARVDGDNRSDLLIVDYDGGTVTIRSGLASGTFGAPLTISVPSPPNTVACGDLNGDGRTDLVVLSADVQMRSYLQQPDGSFVFTQARSVPTPAGAAALADMDGDGKLDLLALGSSAVQLDLGLGDGSFADPIGGMGGGATRIFVGDFNHDGIKDFVFGGGSAIQPCSFRLGLGGGAIGPLRILDSGQSERLLAVGDWNGDGNDDVLLGTNNSMTVFYGGAEPLFSVRGAVPGPSSETMGAAVDADGDGHLDAVFASDQMPGVAVAVGNGDGTFGTDPGTSYPLPYAPVQVEVADLDGDLQLDAAARVGNNLDTYLTGVNGAPIPGATIALPRTAGRFGLRDMNGDGRVDVVALLLSPAAVKSYLRQSDGSYLGVTEHATATSSPLTVATGLLDANLYPDAVVGESGTMSTFVGLGNGTFQSTYYTVAASQPSKVVIAEVTGDGQPDAVVEDGGNILVHPGTGHPWFEPGVLQVAQYSSLIAVQDVDQDGSADIVAWSTPSHVFVLYPNDGFGHFGPPVALDAVPGSGAASFVDMDGDGNLDMVIQRTLVHSISILFGHGQGVFGPEEEGIGLDADARAVVSDFNGDGRPDLFLIGQNFFRVILQTPTQVAADSKPPVRIALSATPNPARGPVSLGYSMPRAGRVELGVYDLHGRLVKELFSGAKPAGEYRQPWDGRDGSGLRAPAGVYFARGAFDGQRAVTKLVLMN